MYKFEYLTSPSEINKITTLPLGEEFLSEIVNINYSFAVYNKNILYGTIKIPRKESIRNKETWHILNFYIDNSAFYIVNPSDELPDYILELSDKQYESGFEHFFYIFLTILKESETYLLHIEKNLSDIEEHIINKANPELMENFLFSHKRLSELHLYYEELTEICEYLEETVNHNIISWKLLTNKTKRLHDYVAYLREYTIQIRELYKTYKDDEQTRVINLLTIVTTMFFPLTLITGWYGMNFSNMPELASKYGYYVLIGIVIVIITCEIAFFTKKFKIR